MTSPHRLAWALFVGEIPEGSHVLHRCDNRSCFNIDHLYLGTHNDNMADRRERNPTSYPHGERLNHNKLLPLDVLKIRRLHTEGWRAVDIHRRWYPDMDVSTIRDVIHRKSWKHIPEEK